MTPCASYPTHAPGAAPPSFLGFVPALAESCYLGLHGSTDVTLRKLFVDRPVGFGLLAHLGAKHACRSSWYSRPHAPAVPGLFGCHSPIPANGGKTVPESGGCSPVYILAWRIAELRCGQSVHGRILIWLNLG